MCGQEEQGAGDPQGRRADVNMKPAADEYSEPSDRPHCGFDAAEEARKETGTEQGGGPTEHSHTHRRKGRTQEDDEA